MEKLESGHQVHMDVYTAITGTIGYMVHDYDVTERVESLLYKNTIEAT